MFPHLDLVLKNGIVVTAGDESRVDVGVADGKVVLLMADIPAPEGCTVIDVDGGYITPGLIDSHVHIAQSAAKSLGAHSADDWVTGTQSALGGGCTTVIAFAVQEKGGSMQAAVDAYHKLASGSSLADYSFHVIVTDPNEEAMNVELPKLIEQGITSVKMYSTWYITPGLIDSHVHIAQSAAKSLGAHSADDWVTGTQSALGGGCTTVIAFAVQEKGGSMQAAVDAYHKLASGSSLADYSFHVIVTDPNEEAMNVELPKLIEQGITSVKMYSTYASQDPALQLSDTQILDLLYAARKHGVTVMVHAENADVISWFTKDLASRGMTEPWHHATSRPPIVEAEATNRILAISELMDCPVLFVHVSAPDAFKVIREAQARLLSVYAETCPHYLLLTGKEMRAPGFEGAKACCSPPLRDDPEDRERVWENTVNGTVTVVSSDHAPYSFDDPTGKQVHYLTATCEHVNEPADLPLPSQLGLTKNPGNNPAGDFRYTPNGLPGIETRGPLMWSEGVCKGRMSPSKFVELSCTAAAKLYGMYPQKGTIQVGSDADFVVWRNPSARRPSKVTVKNIPAAPPHRPIPRKPPSPAGRASSPAHLEPLTRPYTPSHPPSNILRPGSRPLPRAPPYIPRLPSPPNPNGAGVRLPTPLYSRPQTAHPGQHYHEPLLPIPGRMSPFRGLPPQAQRLRVQTPPQLRAPTPPHLQFHPPLQQRPSSRANTYDLPPRNLIPRRPSPMRAASMPNRPPSPLETMIAGEHKMTENILGSISDRGEVAQCFRHDLIGDLKEVRFQLCAMADAILKTHSQISPGAHQSLYAGRTCLKLLYDYLSRFGSRIVEYSQVAKCSIYLAGQVMARKPVQECRRVVIALADLMGAAESGWGRILDEGFSGVAMAFSELVKSMDPNDSQGRFKGFESHYEQVGGVVQDKILMFWASVNSQGVKIATALRTRPRDPPRNFFSSAEAPKVAKLWDLIREELEMFRTLLAQKVKAVEQMHQLVEGKLQGGRRVEHPNFPAYNRVAMAGGLGRPRKMSGVR
ncbi:dihydropyrimidinase, partial [Phenoliferia sp. Uapishka_3]